MGKNLIDMKDVLFIGLFLIIGAMAMGQDTLPQVSYGKIKRHADFSSQYVTKRTIDVWLPDGYSDDQDYSVLYMHDGQSLFDKNMTWNKQEWDVDVTMQKLLDSSKIKSTIIVGIHNVTEERHSDYFPQKPFEELSQKTQDSLLAISANDWKLFGKPVQSDQYLKFIVDELIPFIQQNYSVETGSSDTFIAGSSMGGLISWYALSEYPDVFGGAACLSTHWPGIFILENNPIPNSFFDYLMDNFPKSGRHKVYFDYGTETLDALYPKLQKKADSIISNKGYTQADWKTIRFEGEDHSENAWSKRVHIPLKFLLKNDN